ELVGAAPPSRAHALPALRDAADRRSAPGRAVSLHPQRFDRALDRAPSRVRRSAPRGGGGPSVPDPAPAARLDLEGRFHPLLLDAARLAEFGVRSRGAGELLLPGAGSSARHRAPPAGVRAEARVQRIAPQPERGGGRGGAARFGARARATVASIAAPLRGG